MLFRSQPSKPPQKIAGPPKPVVPFNPDVEIDIELPFNRLEEKKDSASAKMEDDILSEIEDETFTNTKLSQY